MKKLIVVFVLLLSVQAAYANKFYEAVMIYSETSFISDEKKTAFTPLRVAVFQDLAIPWNTKTVGGIDLGLLSTKVDTVYGFQVAMYAAAVERLIGLQFVLGLAISTNLTGIQFGGAAYSFTEVNGLQISLAYSGAEGGFNGLQIAPLGASFAEDTSYGLQIAGVAGYADGLTGIQISGILGGGNVKGLAVSPIRIMGDGKSKHLSGGGINLSVFNYGVRNDDKYSFAGLMLSGFNIGNVDITGIQVGIFNSASEVKGVQVGLINYASSLSGLQIGAINIASNAPVLVLPVINFGF
ncbi:MAG: hypothetical protein FWF00_03070 [Endomicrobia bacterium]|nr:hypothetical protein [Endomicrobiia bacterium]MCL2506657.1 hypothetical protein [Endomicrobiia bacterium]